MLTAVLQDKSKLNNSWKSWSTYENQLYLCKIVTDKQKIKFLNVICNIIVKHKMHNKLKYMEYFYNEDCETLLREMKWYMPY